MKKTIFDDVTLVVVGVSVVVVVVVAVVVVVVVVVVATIVVAAVVVAAVVVDVDVGVCCVITLVTELPPCVKKWHVH